MNIGTRRKAAKIIYGVGGKAFPKDYNWICSVCRHENRGYELTCQNCEHNASKKGVA